MGQRRTTSVGHISALVTILVWGTTFISTKVLLGIFTPIEILFLRFLIGFAALILFYPRRMKLDSRRQEWLFAAAGASGITLYYLFENIALTLTTASNVGIIITAAPFFTAVLSAVFLKAGKPKFQFYIGFASAMVGIALISMNGSGVLKLNLAGDLLALSAAAMWAVYSVLTRKISKLGYSTIQSTRRVFFYGLVFMLPLLFIMDFRINWSDFTSHVALWNILFLGIGASALCFVTWNIAVRLLGAVKTSVYIYLVPVVTVAASVLILNEPLTPLLILGAVLTLIGLWLSETKAFDRSSGKEKRDSDIA